MRSRGPSQRLPAQPPSPARPRLHTLARCRRQNLHCDKALVHAVCGGRRVLERRRVKGACHTVSAPAYQARAREAAGWGVGACGPLHVAVGRAQAALVDVGAGQARPSVPRDARTCEAAVRVGAARIQVAVVRV
eukprot:1105734-Rhodomonas_salina.1